MRIVVRVCGIYLNVKKEKSHAERKEKKQKQKEDRLFSLGVYDSCITRTNFRWGGPIVFDVVHIQEVGRQRQPATTGDHRYSSHVVAPVVRPTAVIETESVRPIGNNNHHLSGQPSQRYQHFRHPTRRPDHQHKRMVLLAPRRPINANQLSVLPQIKR